MAGTATGHQQTVAEPDLVVPGGPPFARAFLGMTAPAEPAEPFVVELARFLAQPGMQTRGAHLAAAIRELLAFESLSAELDDRYGPRAAALDREGSPRHEKARRLLEWFGIRDHRSDQPPRLEPRGGQREQRRRRLFSLLGIDFDTELDAWARGEPVVLKVPHSAADLPFGLAAWNREAFDVPLEPTPAFLRLLEDETARHVLLAYARMGPGTRASLRATVGLHGPARDPGFASGLAAVAPYLWCEDGALVLPGGSAVAWRRILGEWTSTVDLLQRLTQLDAGKAAHLWRALALLPSRRAQYLLTLGLSSEQEVGSWAETLYASIRAPEIPYRLRWRGDVAELFLSLRLAADGAHIDWPGGSLAWLAALRDDDAIVDTPDLDAEVQRAEEEWAGDGPTTDARLLLRLLDGWADGGRASLILKFLGTRSALRYAPRAATPRSVTLLVRNYDRFADAYGTLTAAHDLSAIDVEGLVQQLHRAHSMPGRSGREAALQLQASLVLAQRLMRNRRLAGDREGPTLTALYSLALDDRGGGFGREMMAWVRDDLAPAVGPAGSVHAGRPVDAGEVLAEALTDIGDPVDFAIEGLAYRYRPAAVDRARFDAALEQQQMPDLGWVLETDRIVSRYEALGESELQRASVEIGDALAARRHELLGKMPPGFEDGTRDEELRLGRRRRDLLPRFERVLEEARRGKASRAALAELREHLVPWFTDALLGVVYAAMLPDPDTIYFRGRSLARLHQVQPRRRADPVGPWLPTGRRRNEVDGMHLTGSLFGIGGWLGTLNLRLATLETEVSKASSPALGAWGPSVLDVIPRSLEPAAQSAVAAAVDAELESGCRNGELGSPSSKPVAGLRVAPLPHVPEQLRLILGPSRAEALGLDPCPGGLAGQFAPETRYLLWWWNRGTDGSGRSLDAMVGLAAWRGTEQSGLSHPPLAPAGEASDAVLDTWLYGRLIGLRVRLAAGLEAAGLPPTLQAPLYPIAIAAVLERARPDTPSAWGALEAAIAEVITTEALRDWLIELAFAGAFEPRGS